MTDLHSVEGTVPPSFEDLAADRHYHHLVDKGFTPHQIEANGPLVGVRNEMWWDKGNRFEWPMATALIGFMVFIVLLVKGVPW